VKVWIDQDECTSSGLCEVIASEVFTIESDGLAHLRRSDDVTEPVTYTVPEHLRDHVREAADHCPGECIHIEEG
jgi:ferredoxin